ncbi:helix-turn-helix domain-containing protein [Actinacidiphila reveromycinica]|uniref:helix-turn-helix domain-containing protein n=1 Tax=Actinacidiphila reveromycinica TaxID=659352 RepID=UPI001920B287|nr:helix-turn-helix transcriptional regulator [Streptomyces sp. SN-593]
MGQWEPLAQRIPMDVRRLATQLRRMKDRSGLTVPALAARTAHPVGAWERALAARQVPPLDAVEVLAQASGADYDRVGELWRLAEKASTGGGDRGRGRAVPNPDPLDPLAESEGLPGRHRQFLLLGTIALLAVGALVAVLLTAGPSTGRAPAGQANPTFSASGGPGTATPSHGGTDGTPRQPGSGSGSGTAGVTGSSDPDTDGGDRPLTSGADPEAHGAGRSGTTAGSAGTAGPVNAGAAGGRTRGAGTPSTVGPTGGSAASGPAAGGGGTSAGASAAPPSAPPPTTPAGPSPSPSPTRSSLCLGLVLLGVCLG